MVRGALIQRKQLILPLGLYRSTPNDFKKHYNNNIQNYMGDSRRVERLCSGFPAHSEWASSILMFHSYAHAQEWIVTSNQLYLLKIGFANKKKNFLKSFNYAHA